MTPARGPDGQPPELGTADRQRLEEQLTELRDQRQALAESLGSDDPGGDSGDQADRLERGDALVAIDTRIADILEQLRGPQEASTKGATGRLLDGTLVTVGLADGSARTLLVVSRLSEEPTEAEERAQLTADSPLGLALAGREVGDSVTYSTPRGPGQVTLLRIRPPG